MHMCLIKSFVKVRTSFFQETPHTFPLSCQNIQPEKVSSEKNFNLKIFTA